MKSLRLYLPGWCLVLILPLFMVGQSAPVATSTLTPKKKPTEFTKLSFKAGLNLSVIYLARNTQDNNNEPGFSTGLTYEVNHFIRLAGLYTRFNTINIAPTWRNVKSNTVELNMEMLARFPDGKTVMYPFFGVSYNTYKGYFTGQNDYLNLQAFYKANSEVLNHWLGANIGLGFEHNFGALGIYIDYRMRVGRQDQIINIMDVCFTGGIKAKIPKTHLKKLFRGTNDHFHWF